HRKLWGSGAEPRLANSGDGQPGDCRSPGPVRRVPRTALGARPVSHRVCPSVHPGSLSAQSRRALPLTAELKIKEVMFVTQIVPRLPPVVSGVGDYAYLLARELR